MLTRVDHIDVRCPDLTATVQFLESLGLREIRRLDGERRSVEMALPGEGQVVLEIREDAACERTYVHHVAFGLSDLSHVEVLQDQGVAMKSTPRYVPATGRTVANTQDPGGLTWQLTD